MTRKTISVVSPCYNEIDGIDEAYQTIRNLFDKELPNYQLELIFCDNCSTDGTTQRLRAIAAKDSDVKVIFNSRNFGILNNTYNGVMSSSGDATLLFMPVDLQDPPELIPEFVRHWEAGYEVVYGMRAAREENQLLALARKAYYRVLSKISYVSYPPDAGDFQLVDRVVLEAMSSYYDAQPFMRMMTFESGFRSKGISYTWKARKHGKSRNPIASLFQQGMTGIISSSAAPIRLALAMGLGISVLSVSYAALTAILVLCGLASAPSGIPTLIVAMFLFSGVQLLFLGVIGEYVLAIFNQVRRRPLVVERERLNFVQEQVADQIESSAKAA